jgi:putative membrane protein
MRFASDIRFAGAILALGLTITVPRMAAAVPADEGFIREAASGGKMEVDLGRYASRHAADPQVVRFGQRMMADHGKVNAELARIAKREAIVLPQERAVEQNPLVKKLTALRGAEFDREYMKAMVEDHEADVAKFRDKADSAVAPEVKTFAQKTLPTLEEHLKAAKDIAARLEKHASAR